MRIRLAAIIAAMGILLGLVALPAAANDVGVITGGAADIFKQGGCGDNQGGGGLGVPNLPTEPHKNAFFELVTQVVTTKGPAVLSICGKLGPILSNTEVDGVVEHDGIGAACGSSKGYDGTGTLQYLAVNQTVQLSDVGWKASAGGTLPVTGRYTDAVKNKVDRLLVAEVQAQGATPCLSKTGTTDKDTGSGAESFAVNGAFELTPLPYVDDNLPAGTCKSEADECLYGPKK